MVQTESDQSTDFAKRANISVLSIFSRNKDGSVGYGVLVQDGAPVQLPASIASQQGKLRPEKMTDSSLFGQTSEGSLGISPETQPYVTAIPTPSNQLRCVGWQSNPQVLSKSARSLAFRTALEVALPAFSAGNIASRPGGSLHARQIRNLQHYRNELHSGRPRGCTHETGNTWVCVAEVRDVHETHTFFFFKNLTSNRGA